MTTVNHRIWLKLWVKKIAVQCSTGMLVIFNRSNSGSDPNKNLSTHLSVSLSLSRTPAHIIPLVVLFLLFLMAKSAKFLISPTACKLSYPARAWVQFLEKQQKTLDAETQTDRRCFSLSLSLLLSLFSDWCKLPSVCLIFVKSESNRFFTLPLWCRELLSSELAKTSLLLVAWTTAREGLLINPNDIQLLFLSPQIKGGYKK